MSIAVITTFPEKNYKVYGERMIDGFVKHWPSNIILHVYYEGLCPPDKGARVKYTDLHQVSPDLVAFKNKHKNDPVANGELQQIDGGVRRRSEAGKNDKGKGGRNTEYLLSLAIQFELLKIRSFFAIAADTDGIDGTENNAGAIIDENTLARIRKKKLSPEVLLLENNSYLAFKKSGDLFVTGPTGTNVNDFRAIIINY